jgi:hypothetical protein
MEEEELADALIVLSRFMGGDALKKRAADLLPLAKDVMLAADEHGVPHDELARAAAALRLHNADSERRLRAVVQLGNAAAALERAPPGGDDGTQHNALRAAAGRLERACGEHRRGAEAMRVMHRGAAELAAWREGRLADWLRLRISRFCGATGCFSFFFSNN